MATFPVLATRWGLPWARPVNGQVLALGLTGADMKKTIGYTLLICAIPLLGIVGWYLAAARSANARADAFQETAKNQRLVPVEFVATVPENTPKDQAVYISGSAVDLGNWDAKGLRLDRGDD